MSNLTLWFFLMAVLVCGIVIGYAASVPGGMPIALGMLAAASVLLILIAESPKRGNDTRSTRRR